MLRALTLLTLAATLAGCPDPSPSGSDAGTAGSSDAAPSAADAALASDTGISPKPDASAPDTGQLAPPPDAGPAGPQDATVFWADGSVTGTVLEQVAIDCPQPLELCTRWQEGAPIADEQARHVHLALPKLARAGLQPWQLASASVDGVLLERGNLSTQRWRPAAGTIGRTLRQYALTSQGAYTQLEAAVAHDLGPAGTLIESYRLYRAAGAKQPVLLDGMASEASFSLELPGIVDPISLTACAGEASMERAVELLRATRGTRQLVILRFMNTRMAMAGSYPVHVTGLQLGLSDAAWAVLDSADFFAHTYAAEHHNWAETSVIDFTQEPRLYHTVFRPLAEGQTGLPSETTERVAFQGVNGWGGTPYLDLTTRKADNSQVTERWEIPGRLIRVDETDLTRQAGAYCAKPNVLLVGSGASIGYQDSYQLLTCPQATAPGYALKAVVPVWFPPDFSVVGTKIEGAAITQASAAGRPGHTVKVGAHSVTITTSDAKAFFVDVKDPKGVLVSSFMAQAGKLGAFEEARKETLTAKDGKGVSMVMVRQWAGQGVGESSIYAPLSFELTFGGRTLFVDAMDRLRYVNSHHNWMDSLEARGEGLVVTWRIRYMDGVMNEVEVKKESGEQVLAPTVLDK